MAWPRAVKTELNQEVSGLNPSTTTFSPQTRPMKQTVHVTSSFTSTETIRLIRDGRMEVGEERNYILIATLSPPE